ncbi:UDP-3-O-acyl-N-acetylglucosamine deacetylase [Brevundimonas vesicularis]|uniref:UDP-3-O-acyl-N-acetylglucosamine deacetylase n=1 Tax=Brevundimonas vesicularis TaxID=41276 RepID=UPI001C672410
MLRQRTIKQAISGSGIGVHSGKQCDIRLLPAPVGTGIVFRRTDIHPMAEVPVNARDVRDTQLCTAMVVDGVARRDRRASDVRPCRLRHR